MQNIKRYMDITPKIMNILSQIESLYKNCEKPKKLKAAEIIIN
ncbi:unnamed protein product [marine sediment metagenome]|uniref:Uncharacterized protein n=1 Tax=marine sediment metagenome TaxID=412755 RepID=X1B5D9_9ZZZZ